MRPDRIIVGEVRGIEAIDVMQAMNTGHNGSMTTVHANSPMDLISRLETMLIMSGLNLNPSSARRIIASSLNIIIHLERLKNGKRIISRISEVINENEVIGENSEILIKDILTYKNIKEEARSIKSFVLFQIFRLYPLFLKKDIFKNKVVIIL